MSGTDQLREWVTEARARSLELLDDLDDDRLAVPYLWTVNPILWELCHVAWFQEYWVLRRGAGQEPGHPDGDRLFDSITIPHEERWRLPMPGRPEAMAYVRGVRDRVLDLLEGGIDDRLRYLVTYTVFHEDMHTEALTYTRQALGHPAPTLDIPRRDPPAREPRSKDIDLPGGELLLGAPRDADFCFDNEKWAHPVAVPPFSMAATAVTEGEFASFVMAGGYQKPRLWSPAGWSWLQAEGTSLPLYWRRPPGSEGFERRRFDCWQPIEPGHAMCHVSCYEAEAWCRWAGRRLPTEAEWELAASTAGSTKRTLPWGAHAADPDHANLDWVAMGTVDASAHPDGDTPTGYRQMIGNVWEWTASTFLPYPGFTPDMYEDYSRTSFQTRRVLRGGSWATRSRMIHNTWRNFFQPSRRDVFAGFRTCAV